MVNIILCGGSGTRLWPLSRKLYPKQFVNLLPEGSLFQDTLKRNSFCNKYMVVTNKDHYFMVKDQINNASIGNDNNFSFLLEPVGRNTAPAIALACLDLPEDELVLVTPSDHLIENLNDYRECVKKAETAAKNDYLVTFGIKPEYPETGFGYIESEENQEKVKKVTAFKEKPDKETAKRYIDSGNYYWNSGMFVFKAGIFLSELKKYSPSIYEQSVKAYDLSKKDNIEKILNIDKESMVKIPSESIDYAVMEKSDIVKVVPSEIGWSDLGSFDSIYDIREKDDNGNTITDNNINIDSKNNLIIGRDRKLVTVGLEDTIVIDTTDALLVGKRGNSQLVKKAVDYLKSGTDRDNELTEVHSTAHRPWGTYSVLLERDNYKIKKILVKPGKRLSLQKHMHRSEHWVVVSGTATVQVGEETKIIRKNESTFIKIGELHRLSNNGIIDLVIIETQVGEYVGEDDIERIEDDYKRNI